MTLEQLRLPVLAALGLIALAMGSAVAEPPPFGPAVEEPTVAAGIPAASPQVSAITAWIASVDATPDWKAAAAAVESGPSGALIVSGFSLSSEHDDMAVTFDTITVNGYAPGPDGGFSAASVVVDVGTIHSGMTEFALTRVDLTGVAVPPLAAIAFDPSRPFTSLLRIYSALAKMKLSAGAIGTLAIIEKIEGITSRIAYENVKIDGLAGGKIAALRAGPLTMISPAPESLVELKVERAEILDLDLNAVIHVFDPDAYAGGVGDQVWGNAFGHAGYHGFSLEIPGANVTIADVGIEKFSLRQPSKSFADFLDRRLTGADAAGTADPAADAGIAALMTAVGVGRFAVTDFKAAATGIDTFALQSFHVSGLSSDALAEFVIDGFKGAVEGEISTEFGHFAFGGAKLPGAEALVAALRAAELGGDVDFSSLAPSIAFLEASGIDVRAPDLPRLALQRMRVDLGNYLGRIPTSVTVDIVGLDTPTRLLPMRGIAATLGGFGYDRIAADAGAKLAWNEAGESVSIDGIRLDMKDMGTLEGSATLAGLTRPLLEQSGSILNALSGILFTGATFTFKDKSLVDRGLANRAAAMKVDPEKLRTQLATAMPFMLGFLGNPDFQKQVAPVLKAFLLAPGTITAKAAPPAPVPVPDIARTVRSAPQTLPALLGITLTGDQKEPSPAPPKTEIRSTLDPAN